LEHTSGSPGDLNAGPEQHSPSPKYAVAISAFVTVGATAGTWIYAGPLAALLMGAFVFVATVFVLFIFVIAMGTARSKSSEE
jgi:hypothetical protein